jgi:fluoride exporter
MLIRSLAVALGGAVGAVSRYLLSGWVAHLTRESQFPFGTLAVNTSGAFILGVIMAGAGSGRLLVPPTVRTLLTIGVLGGYTTFSTFSYETLAALRVGDVRVALANVGVTVILGLAACWAGLVVGEGL